MKIEPCVFGGLSITPETIWEEAYLDSLAEDLHYENLYLTDDKDEEFQSLILLDEDKRKTIYG